MVVAQPEDMAQLEPRPDPDPKLPKDHSHPAVDHQAVLQLESSPHHPDSVLTHQAVPPHQINASANSVPTTSAPLVPKDPRVFPEFPVVMLSMVSMVLPVLMPKMLAPKLNPTEHA